MEGPNYEDKTRLESNRAFWKKLTPSLTWMLIIAVGVGIGNLISYYAIDWNNINSESQDSVLDDSTTTADEDCSVIGINLHGTLLTYIPNHSEGDTFFDQDVVASEDVVGVIKHANENPKIKAIVIEVDSGGGVPVAGEEISDAVKNSSKPTVAFIRQTGASAAYWAISGAQKIFASKNSDVGSIGVTLSYLQDVNKNKKDGYEFVSLSTGEFKDTGNPSKPITAAERSVLMRDLKIVEQNFIEAVSTNRKMSIETVGQLADGSTVLGDRAKEVGLVDEIGGMPEVEKYLEQKIGEKPTICWQ